MREEIIGLLQLNDRRTNCFTPDMIRHLEGLAASFGVALRRVQDEQARRQWADAFEHCAHGIAMWSSGSGRIIVCNPALAQMAGRRAEEIAGLAISDLLAPDCRDSAIAAIAAADEKGQIQDEIRMVRGDGSIFPAQIDVRSERDPEGTPVYQIATLQDISARKRTEEELRDSQARLETLFEHSPVAIWQQDFTDVKARIDALKASGVEDIAGYLREHRDELVQCSAAVKVIRVNEASAKVFGMSKDDLPRQLPAYFPPAALDRFADELAALASGCTRWQAEFPVRNPLGGERQFEVTLSMVPDQERTWSRTIVSFSDVTEANRSKNEAMAREAIWRIFLESNPLEITCQKLAETLASTLGFPIAMIGLYNLEAQEMVFAGVAGMRETARGSRVPVSDALCGTVAATGREVFESHAGARPESLYAPLRELGVETFLCVPFYLGEKIAGTVTLADRVSRMDCDAWMPNLRTIAASLSTEVERRMMEEALRESEDKYRSLVETAFDWIWEVDVQGKYTHASHRAHPLLGYTPEEVLGHTPFEFMPEEEAKRVGAIFGEIVGKRQSFMALENTNRHKDGRLVVFETSGVPILGPNGELRGYRGLDRDITERKNLEAQIRQSQKLEAVGQLAGGVAHDFNNILAAIMMRVALIRTDNTLTRDTRESLKELEAETQRAASLTRQLLMFSRRSVLAKKALNANDAIENLLKMLRRLIGEHIDLRFEPGSPLPAVEADAGMLDQVVMNLTVNARDAMPRGGAITIRTSVVVLDETKTGEVPQVRRGTFVCISVEDTGCGMDAATISRIFEPFFTTKEAGKGTGMGLATVHGVVGQHNGWIEVQSEPGVGTTFRVMLPAAARAVEKPLRKKLLNLATLRGTETILLVEDDSVVRRNLCEMLERFGYRVLSASEGREALDIWEQEKNNVALLFSDMVMPGGMSGLELAERLRAEKQGLKIVITSGYSREIAEQTQSALSGVGFLSKPFDSSDLGVMIRSMLDRRN